MVSLPAQGLYDYGVEPVGSSAAPASGLQLVYGDAIMTLARWPNEGFVNIVSLPDGAKGNTFTYAEDNPSSWLEEDDPHGQGYWAHDWAACAIVITSYSIHYTKLYEELESRCLFPGPMGVR